MGVIEDKKIGIIVLVNKKTKKINQASKLILRKLAKNKAAKH